MIHIIVQKTELDAYKKEINNIILDIAEECKEKNIVLTIDFKSKLSGVRKTISRECRQKFVKLTLLEAAEDLIIYEICLT